MVIKECNDVESNKSADSVFKTNIVFMDSKTNTTNQNLKSDSKSGEICSENEWKTNWKAIYIVTLVSFIGAVHQNCFNVWPYLQLMDRSATETFYGLMRSVSGIGSACSALLAGYLCNLLQNTQGPMVFSKVMAIVSCVLYIAIETMDSSRKFMFLLFELLLGISAGSANVYRVYIAHNSTEADRPKAVGICSLAPGFGLLIGPLIQLLFTIIPYPGLPFLFGTHINLFTAPMLLTIVISAIGFLLLIFCFKGHMHIEPDECFIIKSLPPNECNFQVECDPEFYGSSACVVKVAKYDKIAAILCMFTRAIVNASLIVFLTIGSPYMMTVFRWTSTETVKYQSILLGIIGVHIILWNLSYIFFNFQARFSERKAIVAALSVMVICFMTTYPWSFLPEKIQYQEVRPPSLLNETKSIIDEEPLGCSRNFDWCGETPAVNMYVFLVSIVLTMGFSIPLSMINLDILFSKILGCSMKQGTMQGIFIVCGEGLSIVLPLIISYVYMKTGPIYIWRVSMVTLMVCLFCWVLLYSKMISNTKRIIKLREKQDLHN